jgi:hypothetical protein
VLANVYQRPSETSLDTKLAGIGWHWLALAGAGGGGACDGNRTQTDGSDARFLKALRAILRQIVGQP